MAYMDWLGRILFASIFLTSGVVSLLMLNPEPVWISTQPHSYGIMQMKLASFAPGTGGPEMQNISPKLDVALQTLTSNIPNLNFTYRDIQPYYPELYLTAIVLEIGGAIGLILGFDFGAYALVRCLMNFGCRRVCF